MTTERAQATWIEVLRQLKAKYGTYAEIGTALDLHEQTVQGWVTGGNLPNLGTEKRIALTLALDEERLHAALDRLRSEQFLRRLQTHPLAPEVAGNGRPFRRQETTRRGQNGHKARPAGARAAGRVRKPRRKGLGLLITGASLLALASAGYAQPANQVMLDNYAETQEIRRLLSSRRRAA